MPSEGSLQRVPSHVVFLWAAQAGFSGCLLFQRTQRLKQFYVDRGVIVGAQSNLVSEGFDTVLKRYGFINETSLNMVLNNIPTLDSQLEWDEYIIKKITQLALLSKDRLVTALNIQLQERVVNTLGWMTGAYRLSEPQLHLFARKSLQLPILDVFYRLEHFIGLGKPFLNLGSDLQVSSDQGVLADIGGVHLFNRLCHAKASGTLELVRRHKRKQLLWNNGKITKIESSLKNESLPSLLVRWKFLSLEQAQQATEESRAQKCSLRDTLINRKYLPIDQLNQAMSTLHVERILEALSWRSGSYVFSGHFVENSDTREVTEENSQIDSNLTQNLQTTSTTIRHLANICQQEPKNHLILTGLSPIENLEQVAIEIIEHWEKHEQKCCLVSFFEPETTGSHQPPPVLQLNDIAHRVHIQLEARDLHVEEMNHLTTLNRKILEQFNKVIWAVSLKQERQALLTMGHAVAVFDLLNTDIPVLQSTLKSLPDIRIEGFVVSSTTKADKQSLGD